VTDRRIPITDATSIFCPSFSLDTERLIWTPIYAPRRSGSAATSKAHLLLRVWELLGLTKDPSEIYELVVTALNPGARSGYLLLRMSYVR
jgi:hypothetical protein